MNLHEDNILRKWLRRQRGEGIEKIPEDPKKGTARMTRKFDMEIIGY
jgi:hypothetical protein